MGMYVVVFSRKHKVTSGNYVTTRIANKNALFTNILFTTKDEAMSYVMKCIRDFDRSVNELSGWESYTTVDYHTGEIVVNEVSLDASITYNVVELHTLDL